jgi:hypothetical protein
MNYRILLSFATMLLAVTASAANMTLDFYGQPIKIQYDPALATARYVDYAKEDELIALYKEFEKRPYKELLNSLDHAKAEHQLNDWLYFKLMNDALDKICRSRSLRFQGVLSWFLMAKAGYDARATFTRRAFYVNVATTESIFGSPIIKDDGKSYANLSALVYRGNTRSTVYVCRHVPNPRGKDFSFALGTLPELSGGKDKVAWNFDFKGQEIEIEGWVDLGLVELMKDYPSFDEMEYIRTPFSPSIRQSILPQLSKAMRGMSEKESMEFLVAFTRSGLSYGSDRRNFGESRPLTAEEALYYPSVDCEDKVAVIYNLVKELTDMQAVVIAMPDHLSFGVKLKEVVGESIRHKGSRYTICDPTGPENTCEIGVFSNKRRLRQGEILGELR